MDHKKSCKFCFLKNNYYSAIAEYLSFLISQNLFLVDKIFSSFQFKYKSKVGYIKKNETKKMYPKKLIDIFKK